MASESRSADVWDLIVLIVFIGFQAWAIHAHMTENHDEIMERLSELEARND